MRTAFVLIAAIMGSAVIPSAPAMADNWRLASYTDEYPAVLVLVDTDSVRKSRGKTVFRVHSFFEKALEGGATRTLETMETNCVGDTYRVISGAYADSSSVLSESDEMSEDFTASPGSLNEGMILSACGRRDYLSVTIADPVAYAEDYFLELELDDSGY